MVFRRSQIERDCEKILKEGKVDYKWESMRFEYIIPESSHTYTPDFNLGNGVHLECKGPHPKGGLDVKTRRKMIQVKKDHPELDVRFIFDKPGRRVGKRQSWEQWCDKNNFKYCYVDNIPKEWLK